MYKVGKPDRLISTSRVKTPPTPPDRRRDPALTSYFTT
jgi:hypothetical protein